MKSTKKAYLFAGLAVFFWSTVATAFKIALREFDFIQLIFYTSIVSVVVLFVILVIQNKIHFLFQQTRKDLLNSMFLGALNPLLYYLILFKAYSLLPAQLAQPLNMVWPITLVLFSVPLLGQKIGWMSLVALFVSFIGVIFISSQGGINGFENTNWFGVALAIGSSIIWALYWIFNVRNKREQVVKLFQNFCFGTLYLIVVMLLFSDFKLHTSSAYLSVIYIGLFETGITYVLWLKAMELSTNNAKIGNLVFLAPFVSLIFIHFILKETIYITTFIGLVFIVAGIFVQQLDRRE
ncbi:MAG: EamA family transporter [Bacteroidetes bacterium]|nr:EamA family transporter [Bacteroidota bacterium]